MRFESELEEQFYNQFNSLNLRYRSGNKEWVIKAIRPFTRSYPYDVLIQIGKRQIAVIEFRAHEFISTFDLSRLEQFAAENDIRYAVVSDGEQFEVTDLRENSEKENLSFREFIELLQTSHEVNLDLKRQQIKNSLLEIVSNSEFAGLREMFRKESGDLTSNIYYDRITDTYSFSQFRDINSLENRLFRQLLQDDEPLTKIYRYTTLETVVAMLTRGIYRMNCLVGMNDPSEVGYAENYINGNKRNYAFIRLPTIKTYNRRFISSCSLKRDDLTQWRLYANDSRGVCLVLDIDPSKLNSKFIVKRISYANDNGEHPELKLISQILAAMKSLGINFSFRTLPTWRHFFKPFEYKVEQEVRILYVAKPGEKREWFLTGSHSILNPFVEFNINDSKLPIRIGEIMLGPNCPEKEINQRQFEILISDIKRKATTKVNAQVTISNIETYR